MTGGVLERAESLEVHAALLPGKSSSGEETPYQNQMRDEGDADPSDVARGRRKRRRRKLTAAIRAKSVTNSGSVHAGLVASVGHHGVFPPFVLVEDLEVASDPLDARVDEEADFERGREHQKGHQRDGALEFARRSGPGGVRPRRSRPARMTHIRDGPALADGGPCRASYSAISYIFGSSGIFLFEGLSALC